MRPLVFHVTGTYTSSTRSTMNSWLVRTWAMRLSKAVHRPAVTSIDAAFDETQSAVRPAGGGGWVISSGGGTAPSLESLQRCAGSVEAINEVGESFDERFQSVDVETCEMLQTYIGKSASQDVSSVRPVERSTNACQQRWRQATARSLPFRAIAECHLDHCRPLVFEERRRRGTVSHLQCCHPLSAHGPPYIVALPRLPTGP